MQKVKAQFKAECAAEYLPCWICTLPIDYTAPYNDWGNDDRYELDHYYPASTHPEHFEDPANFRPSHAGCNRHRSNKAPRPPLGTPSRRWL